MQRACFQDCQLEDLENLETNNKCYDYSHDQINGKYIHQRMQASVGTVCSITMKASYHHFTKLDASIIVAINDIF